MKCLISLLEKYFKKALLVLFVIPLLVACGSDIPTVETISIERFDSGLGFFNEEGFLETDSTPYYRVSGRVLSDGGDDIVEMGVCISHHPLPTISDTKKSFYDSEKVYTPTGQTRQSVTGSAKRYRVEFYKLSKYATYYFRAYAQNSAGIGYGEVIELSTYCLPIVKTNAARVINQSDVVLNATVDTQQSETEIWFELFTEGELARRVEIDQVFSEGIVKVQSQVANLQKGKRYSYNVNAKNKEGLVKGNKVGFNLFYNQVVDYDGNKYWTVKIGEQIWLAENLRTTHFLNGDPIPNIQRLDKWIKAGSPAWCFYTNKTELGAIYGALYNNYVGTDPRGLIDGFHVPSIPECLKMVGTLGTDVEAAIALKSPDGNWYKNGNGDNSSGFNAMPGGWRGNDEMFSGLTYYTLFQTTTTMLGLYTGFSISYDGCDAAGSGYNHAYYGQYIRLVND